MKIFITGITGMVGSHLAEYIINHHSDVDVHGLVRWRSPKDNIKDILNKVTLHHGDLKDLPSLISILDKLRPDRIFHLAAQSFVTDSFTQPIETLSTNIIGTTNLLEAIRITKIDPLVHICSSSEVYGQVLPCETPIKETNPLRPASPYAVSKVGEDMIAYQYWLSYGIKTIRSRAFTHTGPRRGSVFAEGAFAKQIAEIEQGKRELPVVVGNLDSIRTILDVRDIVWAYWLLLEKGVPGEVYNIGGSHIISIREILEKLQEVSGVKGFEVNAALIRPSDVTLQIPDTTKFKEATGFTPQIPFTTTIMDILNYYRHEVSCS